MKPFKPAKIYNGDKEWFVYYSYWSLNDQKYKREKARLGLKGLDEIDRLKQLKELRDMINAEITARNRVNQYHDESLSGKQPITPTQETLVGWIDLSKPDEGIEESWHKTFSELRHNLVKFYEAHPAYADSLISDVDTMFLQLLVKYLKAQGKASKTINKLLWGISTLSQWIHQRNEYMPVIATKDFRVEEVKNETDQFPPLTHEEKELAFNYFRQYNAGMYLFISAIYYTCIRPIELYRLQVKHFDLKARKIYVPWYKSKNGNSSYVQILEPFLKALADSGIEALPPDTFLFGDKCQPSAEEYTKRRYASNTWTKHREKMAMPVEKQMYGLKHTFNVDYVENNKGNIDWEWLRRHNRHATVQQTQEYISGLTAYFLDESKNIILDYVSLEKSSPLK